MATTMLAMARAAPCLLTSLFFINMLLVYNFRNDHFVYRKLDRPSDASHNQGSVKTNSDDSSINKPRGVKQVYGEYILDTRGCKLKNYNPYDQSIVEWVFAEARPLDCHRTQPKLTYRLKNEIVVNASAAPPYLYSYSHCVYKAIKRNETDDDKLRRYYEVTFTTSVVMHDQHVHVECYDHMDNIIYNEFYWRIDRTKSTEERKVLIDRKRSWGKSEYNVLIVGIDSTSRLNKIRQLPRTSKYLQDNLDVIDFNGYMKVGDNTFPNLVPLLTGNHEEEDPRCFSNRTDSFDYCPFMWKYFIDKGFVTMHAEDRPEWGSFNFERPGFDKPPVDFYMRPIMLAAYLAEKPMSQVDHCIGRRSENKIVLDYLLEFVETFRDQAFFGFTFTSGLSHNSINTLHTVDHEYLHLFKTMHTSGIFEDTIVLFLSDHGNRFGEIRNTRIGHHEDSTPFMNIILPKSFKKKHPVATDNIESNANRLVTMFDIHETLMDILEDRIHIAEDGSDPDPRRERGISLFRSIPIERTCKMAGITSLYCVCEQRGVAILPSDRQSKVAANALLAYVNQELKERTKTCEVLHLLDILEAERITPNEEEEEMGIKATYIRIKIKVLPSSAILEAIISFIFHQDGSVRYELQSGVNRLNMYGDQSWCVVDPILKKFCYCQQQMDDDRVYPDIF